MKHTLCILFAAALFFLTASTASAQRGGAVVYTVTSSFDLPDDNSGDGICLAGSGECTLRAALEEAVAQPDTQPVRIEFDIDNGNEVVSGVWRITLDDTYGPLPFINQPDVTVDGLTQSGASCGNLVNGTPHDLRVILDGTDVPFLVGINSNAADLTVRGLVVQNFSGNTGIFTDGPDSLIECNYVGTEYTGESAAPNGIGLFSIGTVRNNLVSGNNFVGIQSALDTTGGFISRNLVGSDEDGNQPLGNGQGGILLNGTDGWTVTTNLVSANDGVGIALLQGTTGTVLTNNTVGLTRTRADAPGMGNDDVGILVIEGSSDNDIGLPGNGNFVANSENGGAAGIGADGAGTVSNRIRGNTVGLTASGQAAPNSTGISVAGVINRTGQAGGPTIIGGSAAGAGNVVAGNGGVGILNQLSTGTLIEGNTVGLSASGAVRPNVGAGIALFSVTDPVVRGNTVGGNGGVGVLLDGVANIAQGSVSGFSPTTNALVEDNRIGTNASGTAARPNGLTGLVLTDATDATIRGNTISGNTDNGVFLDAATSGHVFEDNFIGTNATGADLGNGLPGGAGRAGIRCQDASNIRIGKNFSPNRIRFNDADGIFLTQNCHDIAIVGNIISANGDLAVDLAPNGPNPNDAGDGDTGANDKLNFPVITSAENDGSNSIIEWTLSAEPNTIYELLFCRTATPDPSGHGECPNPNALATATTNGAGNASGIQTLGAGLYPAGSSVTANATEISGALPAGYRKTSEFSEAVEVDDTSTGSGIFLAAQNTSPLTVAPGGSVSFDYTITNNTPASVSGDLFYTVSPGGISGLILSGTVPAGQTVMSNFTQQVPGIAPPGSYTYTLRIGQFPGVTVDAEAFAVTVTGSAREGGKAWSVSDAAPWRAIGAAAASRAEVLPVDVSLSGAYPNPFSRGAMVGFALPEVTGVRLVLYDVLGREVAVLVDDEVAAGRHEVALSGAGLPSGVYLVRLEAGGQVRTERVTLVR